MRKRWPWVVVGLAAALVALAAFVLWPRPNRITLNNFARIKDGMSRVEVEEILGPQGDYRTGLTEHSRMHVLFGHHSDGWPISYWYWEGMPPPKIEGVSPEVWAGDAGDAHIYFGPFGVSRTCFWPAEKVPQTQFQTVLWRLRRHWRRWFP